MLKNLRLKLSKHNRITEFLGWYGAFATISAYGLLTLELLSIDDFIYQFLNLTAAIGIIVDAFEDNNTQPVILNIVWGIIASIGIFNIIFR